MIYLGVYCHRKSFTIVALSKHGTLLGKARFPAHSTRALVNWACQLTVNDMEKKEWFFDSRCHPYTMQFHHWERCKQDAFFLVDHRKLLEMRKLFYDFSLFQFQQVRGNATPFCLAAAKRFMLPRFIQRVDMDEYLPF
jgi:hypothetical protein